MTGQELPRKSELWVAVSANRGKEPKKHIGRARAGLPDLKGALRAGLDNCRTLRYNVRRLENALNGY